MRCSRLAIGVKLIDFNMADPTVVTHIVVRPVQHVQLGFRVDCWEVSQLLLFDFFWFFLIVGSLAILTQFFIIIIIFILSILLVLWWLLLDIYQVSSIFIDRCLISLLILFVK
jgi:hypothetical protein